MDSTIAFIRDHKVHEMELGSTFRKRSDTAFHTLRYDFKPASVDVTQQGQVDVGENNEVTITLPHVQGKSSNTVYKGSKRPVQKECVLIYDHTNETFTLERVTSQIQVKKTRFSGIINPNPPVLTSNVPMKLPKKSTGNSQTGKKTNFQKVAKSQRQEIRKPDNVNQDDKTPHQGYSSITMPTTKPAQVQEPPPPRHTPPTHAVSLSSSGEDSSSGSSSSSDDESSSSNDSVHNSPKGLPFAGQLAEDLELSDSGSDTD